MLPATRDNRMMQEAVSLAKDGELGNSDAIRLLQIPHSPDDVVRDVLAKFDKAVRRREALLPRFRQTRAPLWR